MVGGDSSGFDDKRDVEFYNKFEIGRPGNNLEYDTY